MTARAPIVVSETAAMKTPQRRQMRKIASAGSEAVILYQ
jgi:hypothetical protein